MSFLPATPKDNVLSLINAANASLPVPITQDNLYFGHPRLDSDGVTTVLPTTAQLGGEYAGYRTFRYTRLDLSKLYDERPLVVATGAATLVRMLPVLNKWLGLNLTADDVIDAPLTLGSGEQVNINIKASPTSLGFQNSLIVRYMRNRPFLVYVTKVLELNTLSLDISPTLGKRSIASALWGEDFTLSASVLALNRQQNYWANVSAVQSLANDYGFDNFPAPVINGVVDMATTDVPTANPAFDRVAIQKGVVGDTYAGDAYFHYNLT